MEINVSIISFGEAAQRIMYEMAVLEQKKDDENFRIVRMYNSFTDEHEDEMDCFCHRWGDAYKRYVNKKVETLLSNNAVNLIMVTRGMLNTLSQVLQSVNYMKRHPIYVILISDNDAALSVEFRKEVKLKCFNRKGIVSEDLFITNCVLNLEYLIGKLVRDHYMTFSQFMKCDLRKRVDSYDDYKFVYISKFIIQKRE